MSASTQNIIWCLKIEKCEKQIMSSRKKPILNNFQEICYLQIRYFETEPSYMYSIQKNTGRFRIHTWKMSLQRFEAATR